MQEEKSPQIYKPHATLVRYRPVSGKRPQSLIVGFTDWLYAWAYGLRRAEQALDQMERRKQRAISFLAEERVSREDLTDQYPGRWKFRRSLVSLISHAYSLNGPVFSPSVGDIRVDIDWYALDQGFTVKVYGYDHWDGECLNAATLSIKGSLPADFTVTVKADQTQRLITFEVRPIVQSE